jgi:hypothetical protein
MKHPPGNMEVCEELSCAERKSPLRKSPQRIKQLSFQEFFGLEELSHKTETV